MIYFDDANSRNNIEKILSRDGCCLVKGIYDTQQLKKLGEIHSSYFEDYQGLSFKNKPSRVSEEFSVNYRDERGRRVDGMPIEHRLMRGQGEVDLKKSLNPMFGKRASLSWDQIPQSVDDLILTENLLDCCARGLSVKRENMSFMLGSLNRVYPHYAGEEGLLHIDTYGFTKNNKITKESSSAVPFLNAIIYMTEANHEISGTRYIKGSHLYYEEINEIIADVLDKDNKKNCIHQRELYDELIELINHRLGKTLEIEQIEAEPGDVFIFSSNLIHGIPGNRSKSSVRDVAILNFGRVGEGFGKVYKDEVFNKLSTRFEEKGIKVSRRKADRLKYIRELIVSENKKLSKYALSSLRKLINKIKNTDSQYNLLNIGAGDSFDINGWTRLDYDGDEIDAGVRSKRTSDINFDLTKMVPLPFKDSCFDGVYSSHTLEHLVKSNAEFVISEAHRILKPGGVLRINLPDINLYFNAYETYDLKFFNWIRDKGIYYYDSWLRMIVREMSGLVVDSYTDKELLELMTSMNREEFVNHINYKSELMSASYPSLPEVHKSAWTFDSLSESLKKAGFDDIKLCSYTKSRLYEFNGTKGGKINSTRPHLSFSVEVAK